MFTALNDCFRAKVSLNNLAVFFSNPAIRLLWFGSSTREGFFHTAMLKKFVNSLTFSQYRSVNSFCSKIFIFDTKHVLPLCD